MNDAMQPVSRPFSDAELARLADDLNRDGFCILRGLFPSERVTRWNRAFYELAEERARIPGGLAPRGAGRFYLTLPWRAPFADPDVFANPSILGVINRVFPQEYVMVQLATDTPTKGSEYQTLHRDFRPLFSEDLVTPLYALAVNFSLVDVTEDNGPMQVVRGSHRIHRDEAMRRLENGELKIESVLMNAGDVLIRSPFALHRGSPNVTDLPRPMVVMGYVMHWLHTPKVDLTVPRAAYEALPEEHRKLLRCEVVDKLPEVKQESYVEFAY